MRTEPDLDKGRLLHYLRERYRLPAEQLDFVPFGLDSWAYVAISDDGSRAFVKLTGWGPSARAAASETSLLAGLAAAGVPVPRPVADRDGGLVGAFEGYDVQVLDYIQGHDLEDETVWPDDLYGRVADLVAAVHASTPRVRSFVPGTEDYEVPFLDRLTATLTAIEVGVGPPHHDDPFLTALRELVLPRAREIHAAIERLKQLRDLARAKPSDDVVCHTDIWGSNLILDDGGSLHLLDWNGARIAPPEADLFMFAGTSFFPPDRFGWFLDRYQAAFRRVDLDADLLGFYLYRRDLEDLAGFVGDVADGPTEAMPPEAMLRIIAELLDEIPHLEDHLVRARAVIRGRSRQWIRTAPRPSY
jgi:spectinomycin phosphotransferase